LTESEGVSDSDDISPIGSAKMTEPAGRYQRLRVPDQSAKGPLHG
jgi:hypothetical protein